MEWVRDVKEHSRKVALGQDGWNREVGHNEGFNECTRYDNLYAICKKKHTEKREIVTCNTTVTLLEHPAFSPFSKKHEP
jgi:dTDP-4-dehydrorhamnose reductase